MLFSVALYVTGPILYIGDMGAYFPGTSSNYFQ